jgi:hypothetical protein
MHSITSATDDVWRDDEAPGAGGTEEGDKADAGFASLATMISEVQHALDRLADGAGRRHDAAVRHARGRASAAHPHMQPWTWSGRVSGGAT